MIYTPMTEKAMKMAYRAHHGQADKGGIPYIYHPIIVAEHMTDEITTCTALLHDILEDTIYKPADLAEKFPKEVVDAVLLLTHEEGKNDYFDYIRAVKRNPVARAVKIEDVKHNLTEGRMVSANSVSENQKTWWQEKYTRALEILTEEE